MELSSFVRSHVFSFRSGTWNNPSCLLNCTSKSCFIRRKKSCVQFALPETAASVLVTSVAVGVAATILAKRLKPSEDITTEALKVCEECGGSGLCSECNGEGYVFKKISEDSAQKARMASKTAATRYTAGLPTKWTYCFKCSSARSCRTCGGSGQMIESVARFAAEYKISNYGEVSRDFNFTTDSTVHRKPDHSP